MKTRDLIIVAAVIVVLVSGGFVVARRVSRNTMAGLLRDAFTRYGLDPAWGVAFGEKESNLDSSAVSPIGAADDKLGRAFGATQITARLLELTGGPEPSQLLTDPGLQAEWTARLVATGACVRFRSDGSSYLQTWGRPATLEDAGAVWNAGRPFAQLGANHVTRVSYVPKLIQHYEEARVTA